MIKLGLFDLAVIFAVVVWIVFVPYGTDPVSAEEISRLTAMAAENPKVTQEWKDFLAAHPAPKESNIREIKKLIEAAAALRAAEKTTGSSLESKEINDYFAAKVDRTNHEERAIKLERRLMDTPFEQLSLKDQLWVVTLWLLKGILLLAVLGGVFVLSRRVSRP